MPDIPLTQCLHSPLKRVMITCHSTLEHLSFVRLSCSLLVGGGTLSSAERPWSEKTVKPAPLILVYIKLKGRDGFKTDAKSGTAFGLQMSSR